MRYRIRARRVLGTSLDAFRIRAVIKRYIMHLVTGMQAPQHLERADLSATIGGMKEIRLYPQDLHIRAATGSWMLCPGIPRVPHRAPRRVMNSSPHS